MKLLSVISLLSLTFISTLCFADNDLTLVVTDIVKPSCNGKADGKITVEAKGGEGPYSYNWNTFPNQYNATAINLSSGIYFVQVKDANGEVYFTSVHVDEPTESTIPSFESGDAASTEITATVTGDNAPYTFKLNGEVIDDATIISSLPIGIHKLEISDANSCEMTQYIQVFVIETNNSEEQITGYRINSSKEQLQKNQNEGAQNSEEVPTTKINATKKN